MSKLFLTLNYKKKTNGKYIKGNWLHWQLNKKKVQY